MQQQKLRSVGLATFPCRIWFDTDKQRWAKSPATPKGMPWQDAARLPVHELTWAQDGPYGIVIPDNVLLIDVDTYKGFTTKDVDDELGVQLPWEDAAIQKTVGGGDHYAFYVSWPCRQTPLRSADIRAAGKGFICSGPGYTQYGEGILRLGEPELLPHLPKSLRTVFEVRQPTTKTAHTHVAGEIESALKYVDPGCGRDDWIRYGMAIKAYCGDDDQYGIDVFRRWSAGEFWSAGQPDNYVDSDIEVQWPTFRAEGGTTPATLFGAALAAGWRPPSTVDASRVFGEGAAPMALYEQLVTEVYESAADVRAAPQLIQKIADSGCNQLQVDLLLALTISILKDAGLLTNPLKKRLEKIAQPQRKERGSKPRQGGILSPDTPMHPDMWVPAHVKGKERSPRGTVENFLKLLEAYGITIEFDEIRKELRINSPTAPAEGVLHDEAVLSYLDSLANLNDFPKTDIRGLIAAVANNNIYNPMTQWVHSAPWDHRDRFHDVINSICFSVEEDVEFAKILLRKWFRGAYAVGAGISNKMEHVLTLIDPTGGAGKTRFFDSLCPDHLRKNSVILDLTNKDSIKTAISYWLVELGELDGTFSRSEQARLNSFLSSDYDELRLPYGRAYIKYPRRTAAWAAINENRFLVSRSGNRRFWPVRVDYVNHVHGINMQQFWAQIAYEVHSGAATYLTPHEFQCLMGHNEEFRADSPVLDLLSCRYTLEGRAPLTHMTITECLQRVGISNPRHSQVSEAGAWFRRRGFQHIIRQGKRGFLVRDITATDHLSEVVSTDSDGQQLTTHPFKR